VNEQETPREQENGTDGAERTANEKRRQELDELQQQVARRLKDNRRFLERFMDDDFEDEVAKEIDDEEGDEDPFEEL